MAHRHRLESLQRLSTQLSSEIATSTPPPRSSSFASAYESPRASAYESPRAFYTPPLSPALASPARGASSLLDLPPSSAAPRPLLSSGGGGDGPGAAADARLARLEEQQAATSKRLEDVEKFYRDKMQSLQQTVTDALFQCQSQIDTHQANFAGLVAKLERKVHEVDDDQTKRALDNHSFFTSSVGDLREHVAGEVARMNSACSDLEHRTKAGFEKAERELASATNALGQAIEGEASQLNESLSSMNDKWVDICIGLDNKAVRLDDAQREQAQASEAQTSARLAELAAELEQSCTTLRESTDKQLTKSADATGEKLDRMTRQIESTNRALARAQEEAKSALADSTAEMASRLSGVADELGQRTDATKAELQAYVDVGLSERLERTEYKTQKMLSDMRVQEVEDAVQHVNTALQAVEGEMEQCHETCSELTTDLMLVESALEAAEP
jgi:hypothetical protein